MFLAVLVGGQDFVVDDIRYMSSFWVGRRCWIHVALENNMASLRAGHYYRFSYVSNSETLEPEFPIVATPTPIEVVPDKDEPSGYATVVQTPPFFQATLFPDRETGTEWLTRLAARIGAKWIEASSAS